MLNLWTIDYELSTVLHNYRQSPVTFKTKLQSGRRSAIFSSEEVISAAKIKNSRLILNFKQVGSEAAQSNLSVIQR